MVLLRPLLVLVATTLSFGQASAGLTVAQVVAKARAAATQNAEALTTVRSLRLEFVATDVEGRTSMRTTLTLAQPGLRLLRSYDETSTAENIVCAGKLDGWSTRRPDALTARKIGVIPFEDYRRLKEMAIDDLAFFALPAPAVGQAISRGGSTVAGRPTLAVEYAYKHGFTVTRHFDAQTFALVASDQKMPDGKLQRQLVEGFTWKQGLAFPTKEVIYIDGAKTGEVSYADVTINPALPSDFFDFPIF